MIIINFYMARLLKKIISESHFKTNHGIKMLIKQEKTDISNSLENYWF